MGILFSYNGRSHEKDMILPPFATPKGFTSAVYPPAGGEAVWFIFSGNQLLVGHDKKTLPTYHEFTLQRTLYLGILKGINLFAGEVEAGIPAPSGWLWSPLRPLYTTLDQAECAIAGCAMQLLHWDRSNKFCGTCGKLTVSRERERCRECKSCGHLAYPKLSLAILALVRRGDQILLARSPQFPEPFYSTLAGFVDPCETLEQCVIREVSEEVGIQVKNVQYFGSQPWPFSYSLMIGFTCEWQEGEIRIDPAEIAEAAWFDGPFS
jgi:NAD+ diphosphatase